MFYSQKTEKKIESFTWHFYQNRNNTIEKYSLSAFCRVGLVQSLPLTSVAINWVKFVVSSFTLSKCFSLGSWDLHPLQSYMS